MSLRQCKAVGQRERCRFSFMSDFLVVVGLNKPSSWLFRTCKEPLHVIDLLITISPRWLFKLLLQGHLTHTHTHKKKSKKIYYIQHGKKALCHGWTVMVQISLHIPYSDLDILCSLTYTTVSIDFVNGQWRPIQPARMCRLIRARAVRILHKGPFPVLRINTTCIFWILHYLDRQTY